MPNYDYACSACGHTFEAFQMMSAKPLEKCPACGKKKLRRLIGTGAGIIFKGGGFYETDYKKSAAPASETKSETKSSASCACAPSGACAHS
jgi:putative FmdB family regulatory protein